jgi:hypothetical protein
MIELLAMRIRPVASGSPPRATPPEGMTILGHFISGNVFPVSPLHPPPPPLFLFLLLDNRERPNVGPPPRSSLLLPSKLLPSRALAPQQQRNLRQRSLDPFFYRKMGLYRKTVSFRDFPFLFLFFIRLM